MHAIFHRTQLAGGGIMAKGRIPYVLVALLGLALTGCASQPRRDLANLPGKNACFWTRNVFDWTVLNDSTVLVHAPSPNEAFLIKLFYPIPGLQFHEVLGFEGGDGEPGQFCKENGYLIVRGPPEPARQPVVAVRALTTAEAKQVLASAGKTRTHRMASQVPPSS
jgi:hypothetical protein